MAGDVEVLSTRARVGRLGLAAYGAFIYVFLFAPIVLLVLFSFNANRYGTFPVTAWTLKWYRDAIGNYQIHDALSTTLKVAAEVTVISVVVGTAAAFPLVRSRLPFRNGILVAFILSLDEFIITYFLIGDRITLPIYIYTQIKFGITPEVNALASMLLGASLLVLALAFALPQVMRATRRAFRPRAGGVA